MSWLQWSLSRSHQAQSCLTLVGAPVLVSFRRCGEKMHTVLAGSIDFVWPRGTSLLMIGRCSCMRLTRLGGRHALVTRAHHFASSVLFQAHRFDVGVRYCAVMIDIRRALMDAEDGGWNILRGSSLPQLSPSHISNPARPAPRCRRTTL